MGLRGGCQLVEYLDHGSDFSMLYMSTCFKSISTLKKVLVLYFIDCILSACSQKTVAGHLEKRAN